MGNKHLNRSSEVFCSNQHCAEVNGVGGLTRQAIKDSVITRAPKDQEDFLCYYCELVASKKYGPKVRTKRDIKKLRAANKAKRESKGPKVMTAEETT